MSNSIITDDAGRNHSESNLEIIEKIHQYYGSSDMIDSTNTFYKIISGRYSGGYLLQRANENEYESWDSLKDALETIDLIEIWHQGSEEAKALFFDEDVLTVAEVGDFNNWEPTNKSVEIIKLSDITDYNQPAYCFYHVGLDADGSKYIIETNNTNTTCADRKRARISSWSEIRSFINNKDIFKSTVQGLLK